MCENEQLIIFNLSGKVNEKGIVTGWAYVTDSKFVLDGSFCGQRQHVHNIINDKSYPN